jgi:phage gp45-like
MTGLPERLQRRVQNGSHLCATTTAPDDSGATMTVQMAPDDVRTFEQVPIVHHFGFSSSPPVGSLAMRVNLNGDSSSGVAVGTVHQKSRQTGLTPGQTIVYDQFGTTILLSNDGKITITPKSSGSGGTQIVISPTEVEITAPASVSMTTPTLRSSANIIAGNGFTGNVPVALGKVMTVVGGLITNVY